MAVQDVYWSGHLETGRMTAMPSYREYCPIAVGAEFFGDRWTPLILRELILGSRRFNDIHRGLGRMSRTLLTQRLRELERRGIVERTVDDAGRTQPQGADVAVAAPVARKWRWKPALLILLAAEVAGLGVAATAASVSAPAQPTVEFLDALHGSICSAVKGSLS